MAIKQLIELIGDDIVIAKMRNLAKENEKAIDNINKSSVDLKFTAPDAKPIKDFSDQTIKLKDALHALRPILQAAGIQFSEFGALTRLASTSLIGLAAATAGAIVVGLAKLEETIAKTKGTLSDLFGSQRAGEQAFKGLESTAKSLSTTVETIAPGFEALKTAIDRFVASTRNFKFVALKPEDLPTGSPQNIKNITDAYDNFLKLLRAGKLSTDDAAKAATAFFNALKSGALTADALKALPRGTVELLAQALGKGAIDAEKFIAEVALAPIPVDKLVQALARFSTQAQTAFDTKAVKGMNDAFGDLLNALTGGFEKLTGRKFGDFVVGEINAITKGVKDSIQELQDFKLILDQIGATDAFKKVLADAERNAEALKKLRPAAQPVGPEFGEAFGFIIPAAQKEQIQQQFEQLGKEGSDSFQKGFRSAPTTFQPQALKDFFSQDVVAQAEQAGIDAGTKIAQGFQVETPQILTFFQLLYEQIKQIFAQPIPWTLSSNTFLSQQPTNLAAGGFVRGPGSTTSDSILAFLSNKEFVVNARAVSHYGSDLFAALNAMRLPKDFISRFSMGGLARALSTNRFAAGGQVSAAGNRSLTLVLDQKRFSMSGPKQTIDDLEREASLRGLAMIGKAPSWIR